MAKKIDKNKTVAVIKFTLEVNGKVIHDYFIPVIDNGVNATIDCQLQRSNPESVNRGE